jgi:hypothetical protein
MAAACKKPGLDMTNEHHSYHRQRERHCRTMAKSASDPDVRRRHEELAELHASRAAQFGVAPGSELGAA